MTQAFEGLRIVDLSTRLSGAWAARLFADFGAEVTMIESPEGHPLRHEPPFLDGEPGMERSLLHGYANWNKRSAVTEDDIEACLGNADVVVTTDLAHPRIPPGIVHLSITPHGLAGPLAEVPGNNLTNCARVGWAAINRLEGEPPLQLPVRQTGYIAGVAGYIDRVLRDAPHLRRPVIDLLDDLHGGGFIQLSAAAQDKRLRRLASDRAESFEILLHAAYTGYYSDADVLGAAGWRPAGGAPPEPFDPTLLDAVRKRGPIYRDV